MREEERSGEKERVEEKEEEEEDSGGVSDMVDRIAAALRIAQMVKMTQRRNVEGKAWPRTADAGQQKWGPPGEGRGSIFDGRL